MKWITYTRRVYYHDGSSNYAKQSIYTNSVSTALESLVRMFKEFLKDSKEGKDDYRGGICKVKLISIGGVKVNIEIQ